MSYEKMMKRFLGMDNDTHMPVPVRVYMVLSKKFRDEVNQIQSALAVLRDEEAYDLTHDLSEEIIEKIKRLDILYEHSISSARWLIAGVIIWLSIMLITFSKSFEELTTHFGAHLLIPVNIVLGLGISIYAVSYIATHIDELKKLTNFPFK